MAISNLRQRIQSLLDRKIEPVDSVTQGSGEAKPESGNPTQAQGTNSGTSAVSANPSEVPVDHIARAMKRGEQSRVRASGTIKPSASHRITPSTNPVSRQLREQVEASRAAGYIIDEAQARTAQPAPPPQPKHSLANMPLKDAIALLRREGVVVDRPPVRTDRKTVPGAHNTKS